MACLINPIEEDQCVYLSYEGELLLNELAAAKYEAFGLLRTKRWARMVLDLTRLHSVLTGVQVFDFAAGLAGQLPRDVHVALVVRPDQVQDAGLIEKIARTDGMLLAYFLDLEKAALWVKQTNAPYPRNTKHATRRAALRLQEKK